MLRVVLVADRWLALLEHLSHLHGLCTGVSLVALHLFIAEPARPGWHGRDLMHVWGPAHLTRKMSDPKMDASVYLEFGVADLPSGLRNARLAP